MRHLFSQLPIEDPKTKKAPKAKHINLPDVRTGGSFFTLRNRLGLQITTTLTEKFQQKQRRLLEFQEASFACSATVILYLGSRTVSTTWITPFD